MKSIVISIITTVAAIGSASLNAGNPVQPHWVGVAVGDKGSYLIVGSATSEGALDQQLLDGCEVEETCRILVKQRAGCVALAKDESKAFFGAAIPIAHAKKHASAKALDECKAHGHGTCAVVDAECAIGSQ